MTISVIFESTDGTLWLGGSEGEAEEQTGIILSFRENPWIRAKRGGDAADETDDGTPRIHPNAGFTRFNISDLNVVNPIATIAEDAAGNLWFGGEDLLLRFDGKDFEQIAPTRNPHRIQDEYIFERNTHSEKRGHPD